MPRWVGPSTTSSMSPTSAWPATPWTPGQRPRPWAGPISRQRRCPGKQSGAFLFSFALSVSLFLFLLSLSLPRWISVVLLFFSPLFFSISLCPFPHCLSQSLSLLLGQVEGLNLRRQNLSFCLPVYYIFHSFFSLCLSFSICLCLRTLLSYCIYGGKTSLSVYLSGIFHSLSSLGLSFFLCLCLRTLLSNCIQRSNTSLVCLSGLFHSLPS